MKSPQAIIFDMDDTLAATAPLWRVAEEVLLRAIGHEWSAELSLQYKGMNAMDVAATIHRVLKPSRSLVECQQILRDTLIEQFVSGRIVPMPGAAQCVRDLATIAPLAVASGSPLVAIETAMDRVGIRGLFKVLISSESVPRGKPHPDVFLAAAKAMGALPEKCLVVEDSFIGVQAAIAAGMRCFAVSSSRPAEIRQIATRMYRSLAEITAQTAFLD